MSLVVEKNEVQKHIDLFRKVDEIIADRKKKDNVRKAGKKQKGRGDSVVPQNKMLLLEKRRLKRKCYRTNFHNLATLTSI